MFNPAASPLNIRRGFKMSISTATTEPGDRAALGHFIEFLRREKVISAEKIPIRQPTPAEQCAQEYKQYLREERVLAEATIVNYVPFIDRFLNDRFGAGPVKLSSLRATDVIGFVQRQAPQLQLKRAKLLTTALRSFCSTHATAERSN